MHTLRVLIADDELGMRLGVTRILRGFRVRVPDVAEEVDFTVDQAGSGEEALEKIQALAPHILLLDHKMPGISGLDVLDQLAGMNLDMLTIMITAYASIETAVTATKRGAYDFLAKPFTPDELNATIRKAAARLVLAGQARKLAEEKRQVRFQFIRVLGHELKAPLAAIEGYLQMLQDRSLGDQVEAYDEAVGRSLVRLQGMHKLIADLLDMTRIESGQKHRAIAEVDLCAAGRRANEARAPQAHAAEVRQELPAPETVLIRPIRANRDAPQQSPFQRRQIQPARRPRGSDPRWRRPASDDYRGRHGHRHDSRGDGSAVRRVRADPQSADAPHHRQRPGLVDRQEVGDALRWRRRRREPT